MNEDKNLPKRLSFADIASSYITLRPQHREEHALVAELIDSDWFQRLRDISQTANTRLVYMFSEHSRFGHSLGVADLALRVLDRLNENHADKIERIERLAVSAAALLHDVGHLAPGSHTAFRTWYPDQEDCHEQLSCLIISQSTQIRSVLDSYEAGLAEKVVAILQESSSVAPWTWQLISGAGWNADRGNWCITDSVLAGVQYGSYNVPALVDSLELTADKELALRENRLDAMMHFAISRHAMYRQIYQHRVLLAADCLCQSIANRARSISKTLPFCDEVMQRVLSSKDARELSLDTVFQMREPWWRYHVTRWRDSEDQVLADLCDRLIHRRLLKTVRVGRDEDLEALLSLCREAVSAEGFDPELYLHVVQSKSTHQGEGKPSMKVVSDHGQLTELSQTDSLFSHIIQHEEDPRAWIVLPGEAKRRLGRER